MATWAVVKAQARDILGINLTDADFDNVPLLATDLYGNFIKGPNGFPQVVTKGAGRHCRHRGRCARRGRPDSQSAGSASSLADAVRTGHQFLIDIAHNAVPVDDFGNPLHRRCRQRDQRRRTVAPGTLRRRAARRALHGRRRPRQREHRPHRRPRHLPLPSTTVSSTRPRRRFSPRNDLAFLNEWLLTPVCDIPNTGRDRLPCNGTASACSRSRSSAPRCSTSTSCSRSSRAPCSRWSIPSLRRPRCTTSSSMPSIVAEFAHTVYPLRPLDADRDGRPLRPQLQRRATRTTDSSSA